MFKTACKLGSFPLMPLLMSLKYKLKIHSRCFPFYVSVNAQTQIAQSPTE